ncbi:Glycerol-3-phosphate acyltransferase 1 [Dendrobium catenatum]|uniref:Glycerol-3-phosphate acyltransferase 1 n=2 Tax=Dendrobium catenatum TaxID=906689 RepID=A0A2I0X532_9ASPA|nr:Glycerol-3-phosphate acyltransferase 1 [Dendrobium catenatum]
MWHQLPRENFPKSLIFHDGRIAFLPAPAATLAMFIWLPFGATLSIFRHINGMFFPYYISFLIGALTGIVYQHSKPAAQTKVHEQVAIQPKPSCGRLYICNHRTLLDPLFISACLNKQVTAVVYSLSRVSEFLSPIKTARLTRNKEEDREKMKKLLEQGDLVICPEGTTCREPYLLRFSPLFAELADEITPVALTAEGTMFYGTTACGFKWLDSFYFLMNPRPKYVVQLLEEISVVLDNGKRHSPCEMANRVQREIGRCLGFKCTTLTRKDKYQMLAGNDGIVQEKHNA